MRFIAQNAGDLSYLENNVYVTTPKNIKFCAGEEWD